MTFPGWMILTQLNISSPGSSSKFLYCELSGTDFFPSFIQCLSLLQATVTLIGSQGWRGEWMKNVVLLLLMLSECLSRIVSLWSTLLKCSTRLIKCLFHFKENTCPPEEWKRKQNLSDGFALHREEHCPPVYALIRNRHKASYVISSRCKRLQLQTGLVIGLTGRNAAFVSVTHIGCLYGGHGRGSVLLSISWASI